MKGKDGVNDVLGPNRAVQHGQVGVLQALSAVLLAHFGQVEVLLDRHLRKVQVYTKELKILLEWMMYA
jgi:hypothetical protein